MGTIVAIRCELYAYWTQVLPLLFLRYVGRMVFPISVFLHIFDDHTAAFLYFGEAVGFPKLSMVPIGQLDELGERGGHIEGEVVGLLFGEVGVEVVFITQMIEVGFNFLLFVEHTI